MLDVGRAGFILTNVTFTSSKRGAPKFSVIFTQKNGYNHRRRQTEAFHRH